MSESKSHKATANRIASKLRTDYNDGPGADVKSSSATVEVETEGTVNDAMRQLKGHRGPVYIAGTNQSAVDKALDVTKGTTVGVMDRNGKVVRRSTRKR